MTEKIDHGKVVIVGPGAIGTTLAVHLARAGVAVTVLDHRPERAARIAQDGLRLMTAAGLLEARVKATVSLGELGRPDLVLVCVKCPALEATGRQLSALRSSATIVPLENGLGVAETLRRGLGGAARQTVLQAVTYQAASPGPDGIIRHVANLPTVFEGGAAARPLAARAAAIFEQAGLPAQVVVDLRQAIWRKLVANVAINPLTALAGVRNGELLQRPELLSRMRKLAREAAQVARAEGQPITDAEAEELCLQAAAQTADNISSMRQDVEAGRPTEIDFLNGAVLCLAERHYLDLPEMRQVTQAIRCLTMRKPS